MAKHATARSDAARYIQEALTLHQQGRLVEADALYGTVLAADPQHFDALHLRGVLNHQQGRRRTRYVWSPPRSKRSRARRTCCRITA